MKQKRLIDFVGNEILQELSSPAAKAIMEDWERIFCPKSKAEKQSISLEQFHWHTFSFGYYSSIEGDEAISAYLSHKARSYFVIPELRKYPDEVAFEVEKSPSAELFSLYKDFYVFPKNIAWTMAFTHESGWLGPYFAKHPDYVKLNEKNIQSVVAFEKGWA